MEDEEDLGRMIGPVQIGGLYYDLDTHDLEAGGDRTARVTSQTFWDENDNYPDLTSVVIPSAVKYDDEEYRVIGIGYGAFAYCSRLESVTLPDTLTEIDDNAFWGCSGLTSIVIPDSVRVIKKNAFYDCPGLAFVELPDSLVSIGDRAFDDSEITSIRFPDSITQIGESVFSRSQIPICNSHLFAKLPHAYCGEYIVPEGIETIAPDAFRHYTDVAFSVVLPTSVTYIGKEAFCNCKELTSLTCRATVPPALGKDVFSLIDVSLPVYVPTDCIEQYKSAPQWSDFADIRAMPM